MKLRLDTVFNKIDPVHMHPNEILAVVFHRTAAIVYAIYTCWGIGAVLVNLDEFTHESVHDFSDFFIMLIPPVALLACLGATCFPRWGRMELFADGALCTLVAIFLVLGAINAWQHYPEFPKLWVNFILNTSHIVLPGMRAGFIFRTLVWKAKEDED